MGQLGIDLQADIAIQPGGPVVHGAQDLRRTADILQRQRLIDLLDGATLDHQAAQGTVIVIAPGNGLLKDGRVGRHAADTLIDQRLQFT